MAPMSKSSDSQDEIVDSLIALFRDHPAWREAASIVARDSMSNVYFTHRPGETWHLERGKVGSNLVPGGVDDPDFVFRFSPGAVAKLSDVRGGVAKFALELFSLIESGDPDERVEVRVAAPFARLREHGFLTLLLQAGPTVAVYGLRRGIVGVSSLAKFARQATNAKPQDWEV